MSNLVKLSTNLVQVMSEVGRDKYHIMLTIYLDNCCYNRPFDDRSNIKNYLEREAVLIVMQIAYEGNLKIIGSDVLEKEMVMILNPEKRKNVQSLYHSVISSTVKLDEYIIQRAKDIVAQSSIKPFDSLHLASAESNADILLTTDIKFLKAANRQNIKIAVKNPIDFLLEVTKNDSDDSFNQKQ